MPIWKTISSMIFVIAVALPVPVSAQQNPMHGQGNDWWNPGWMQRDHWRPGHMGPGQRQRMMRHWAYMNEGVPAPYRGARSTISTTPETVAEGQNLYSTNCVSCHGATGLGDGDAGRALTPSPALLAHMVQMPMAVDEYLIWSISDGGEPFGTDMPAFKDVLTNDEIWKIIAYMRAGFPQSARQ